MASSTTRALALPLLALLHLLFTLFSLLLRITEAFSTSETAPRQAVIPQHIALCLPSRLDQRSKRGSSTSEKQRRALIETLKRAARWAVEDGVREVSVYSDLSFEGVPEELRRISVSAATSRTSSSSPSTRVSTPPDSLSTVSLPEQAEDGAESEASLHPSPTPTPTSSLRGRQTLKKKAVIPTTTLVLGDTRHGTVKMHFLPELDMAPVASKYAQSGTPPSQITVQSVDTDIRNMLGMDTDPELLIIHPLSPLGSLRSLLPRPAPELCSYPFWHLRITEIYQTPQYLPLVTLLAPVVQRLRLSSLPALVKLGFAMPLVTRNRVRGALRRTDWEAGLDALCKVEQRLGK